MHNHHNALTMQHVLTTRAFSGILYCTCTCAHACTHTHTLSNSSVDIVTRLQIGQSWFNYKRFSLLQSIQTSSGAHPTSYSRVTGHSYPKGRAASVKMTTHLHLKLYFHSPSMPSRCGQGHFYLHLYIHYQCLHPSILTRSFVCHLTSLPRNLVT